VSGHRHASLAALAALVLLVLGGCGGGAGSPARAPDARSPVVVDTDLSTDDIVALLYLTRRDDVDIRAVTVSGTGLARCPAGARNALALLAAAGRDDIPVACGPGDPLAGFNAFPPSWRDRADAMFGLDLPAARRGPETAGAVTLMHRAVTAGAKDVTVLSLAPLTDTAHLLRAHPDARSRIASIVAMGGAVDAPGNIGPGHERVEYNLWVDPTAAGEVLHSGVPLALVPLDATNQVPVTNEFAGALERHRADSPAAGTAWRLFRTTGMFTGGQYFWDPLAATALTDRQVLRWERRRLSVITAPGPQQGRTISRADGVSARVATDADRAAFERDLLATLTGRPGVRVPRADGAALTYDGRACRLPGITRGPAGPVSFDTEATGDRGFEFVVGALHGDHTVRDLRTAVTRAHGRLEPSTWFTEEWKGSTPPRSRMTWVGSLGPGRKAVACVDANTRYARIAAQLTVIGRTASSDRP
jgi:pyrimidine-specific ribonucleoside hydrolase